MRQIKFRAWDKVNKRMGYFKPGFTWCDEYYTWDLSSAEGTESIMDVPPGDNIEFMQFTGLLDKNGKEIYEGDVLKGYALNNLIVKCNSLMEGCYWEDKYGNGGYESITGFADEYEVIGNIYENPELL